MRARVFSSLSSIVVLWAAPLVAQTSTVVIAADVEGGPTVSDAQLDALVGALGPAAIVPPSALAPIARDRLSREPHVVSEPDIQALTDAVRELETMVAMRQRDAATRQAQRVEELSRSVSDAIATQPALGATILSGCLAAAWLGLQSGREADARARLSICRAAHPEVAVDAHTTAPPVYRLLVEVDAQLASRATHRVTITGTPEGCAVSIDGHAAGATGTAAPSLADGEHLVRLACAGLDHARLHTLSVAGADATLAIDPSFDQALRTTDRVRLVFADAASAQEHRIEYGLRLAAIAGASEVILVSATATGVHAERATLGRGVIASADYVSAQDASRAARELAGTDAATFVATSEGDTAPPSASSSIDVAPIVGGILGAAGVVVLGVGWGYYAEWARVDAAIAARPDPTLLSTMGLEPQREYYAPLVLGLGLGGAGLAAVSVPLWLPPEHDVPWWSWLVGGVGVALLGTGAALAGVDTSSNHTLLMGEMFMASSAMFLAVPTTHLFRLAFGPLAPAVTVDAGSTHASLILRGSF